MNRKAYVHLLAILLAGMAVSANDNPGIGIHPAYRLHTMRPEIFQPKLSAIDFLAPDKAVIVTWKEGYSAWAPSGNRWGEAYILEGMAGTDRNAIKITKIYDRFKNAMGVAVVNGEIYVGDIDRLVKLVPGAPGSMYEAQEIAKYPSSPDGWFEYAFGPVFVNGYFYMTLAAHVSGGGTPVLQKSADRSTLLRIPKSGGSYEVVASGFRAPDGIALGPQGEIFVTDNQGSWQPTSKLQEVVQGRFYGYNLNPPSKFQDKPFTPPSLWLPYKVISDSPTKPYLMPSGTYKGQMFFGDISRGGLYRAYLEKVFDPVTNREEYQGGVLAFTGGLEVGVHGLNIQPTGELFFGGLGQGSDQNQGWNGKKWGFQKLAPIPGALVFEMLAVHSRKAGMEIEFTKEAGPSAASASTYKVSQWGYVNMEGYGSGKQPTQNLSVSKVVMSPDRKRAYLEIPGLKDKGTVVQITTSGLRSVAGDTLWYKETFYTLRAISQSEPFTPPAVSARPLTLPDPVGLRVLRTAEGSLRIVFPSGEGRQVELMTVELMTLQGRRLARGWVRRGEVVFAGRAPDLKPGAFLLRWSQGGLMGSKKIVL